MLSRVELETLLISAQKDIAFGDGTTRVDAGHLSELIEEVLGSRELIKYSEDLQKDQLSLGLS